jgi:glycosyltransferase involved in cell wall biosynthesis
MESQKCNIIFIVQPSFAGVERYLSMLLSNINRDLYRCILICSQNYDLHYYKNITDEVEQITMCREISIVKDFAAIRKIRHIIKLYRPAIVYCHSSKGGALGRLATLWMTNKPKIIYNPHGWSFNMKCSPIAMYIFLFVEKILALITDKIIAISHAEQESALQKRICKKHKITVIYNGIELNKTAQSEIITREMSGVPPDAFVIGMAGRISKQKAPDTFVEACRLIKTKIQTAYFIIVGDGELREDIEKQIVKYDLQDSFMITGWVADALPYIRIFDVALLLSRWEGFGLVLAEYMIAKKPIVATNIDAIPELVENNKNGLLVPVDNSTAVCEAVLTIKYSPELGEQFAEEGFRIVNEKFNIMRVIYEHEKLFQQLVKQ